MNSKFLLERVVAILLISLACGPATLLAQTAEDTFDNLEEQSDGAGTVLGDKRFFVMPIPMSNPTVGTGLGVSTMYMFEAGENAPPSSVYLMALYTDTDTWAGALGTETFFEDDKYRLTGWAGYYDANLEFYGIGNDAGDNGESITINQNGPFLVGRFLFRIAKNLYLGPAYRYIANETSLKDPWFPDRPGEIVPTEVENVSSGLGATLEYDTRDNRFFPVKGSHGELTINLASEEIGSDNSYQQYDLYYNLYKTLREDHILAWRGTGCFRSGDTPYWDLCMFAGEQDAKGGLRRWTVSRRSKPYNTARIPLAIPRTVGNGRIRWVRSRCADCGGH